MSRRDRRYGRQVFNQFFLREKYPSNEEFEEAIEERLKNPYWDIGNVKKARVKITRNRYGARIVVYRSE